MTAATNRIAIFGTGNGRRPAGPASRDKKRAAQARPPAPDNAP